MGRREYVEEGGEGGWDGEEGEEGWGGGSMGRREVREGGMEREVMWQVLLITNMLDMQYVISFPGCTTQTRLVSFPGCTTQTRLVSFPGCTTQTRLRYCITHINRPFSLQKRASFHQVETEK